MSVEDAVKLVVSGGIVTPPSPLKSGKSVKAKTAKRVAASKKPVKKTAAVKKSVKKKSAAQKKQ
jgi:uncharacterized membrane protein